MESSSGESFLWTDASEDSNSSLIKSAESNKKVYEEIDFSTDHNLTMADSLYKSQNENIAKNIFETSYKRKIRNSSDDHEPEKKQIKLEPESDIEVRKKKKRKKDLGENHDDSNFWVDEKLLNKKVKEEEKSLLLAEVKTKKKKKHKKSMTDGNSENESHSTVDQNKNELEIYLEKRVKEEQASSIAPEDSRKRKKCISSNSNFDCATGSQLSSELNSNEMENNLNLRVKEEQTSEIEAEPLKSKKKKKSKHSSSDMEDTMKSNSVDLKSCNIENNNPVDQISPPTRIGAAWWSKLQASPVIGRDPCPAVGRKKGCSQDQISMEYTVIEEKFSAEETIVEKRKQKKRKKDKDKKAVHSTNDTTEGIQEFAENFNGDISDNDVSIQPTDFSCNNIVSSTIINASTTETDNKHAKHKTDSTTECVMKHTNGHRSKKISDRIRFEDDESLSQEPNSSKLPSKIQDFLKTNPHLQVQIPHSDCLITEDDEIWVLRCPREMNYHKLKSTDLPLEGKCKIKINGQTFDGVPNEDTTRIILLTNQHGSISISNLPVKGHVSYRKRIPKIHIPQDATLVNNQTNFIPLPETKCRHPLFGDKYKKAIEIPTDIAKRLEAAKCRENDDSSKEKTKKKHKKDKNKSLEVKLQENCSQENVSIRRKKKRKNTEDNDAPSTKRKKIKHDPDSPGAWESEKAIEENLFNF